MNLKVLKKSRRVPRPGDIFVMQPPDGQFLFGRVIDTNANPLGIGKGILFYIYRARSNEKTEIPDLSPGQLLIAPGMTNRLPWSRGYFEHLENRPLKPGDTLRQHCFKQWNGEFLDEQGNRLPGPTKPVGTFGLHSYRTIDDEITEALGIPLADD